MRIIFPGLTLPLPLNVLSYSTEQLVHSGLLGLYTQIEEHFEQSVHLTLIVTVAPSVFPSLFFTQYFERVSAGFTANIWLCVAEFIVTLHKDLVACSVVKHPVDSTLRLHPLSFPTTL